MHSSLKMTPDRSQEITQLLVNWGNGDSLAREQLMPLVYDELRRMARGYMRRQPSAHTFQTTELIHEAYLKLANQNGQNWQNRAHFFGVAASTMRHILVDYARSKTRQKRGGKGVFVTLGDDLAVSSQKPEEIVALDDALNRLGMLDERKSKVVEMKFFAGMELDEIAGVLKVSEKTVRRDWQFSRTWLFRELSTA
jgi:RNA polymerase sigma factor (TIGR02999 family)